MHHPGEADTEAALAALATRMFDTARHGDVATLRAYLEAGLPVNLTNDRGDTLLMLAAYYGHPPLVQLLCHRGAEVNRCNDRNQSPLAGAVFKDQEAVVALLVEHGADATLGTPSARQTAQMFGQDHLTAVLLPHE